VRSTYQERPTSGTPSVWRITLSVISILVAGVITVFLVVEILDLIDRQEFNPEQYFWFFSIQTSIANIAILMASGIIGFQSQRDRHGLVITRGLIVGYSILTMAIYYLLFRETVDETLLSAAEHGALQVLRVGVPLYLALDWLFNPHRHKLTWWFLPLAALYPGIWFGATILRGSTTGWYPSEFINPTGTGGWDDVLVFLGFVTVSGLMIFTALILINRVHHRLHKGNTLDR